MIAWHVDSISGPAVFYRLRQLRPGDLAVVQRRDGRLLTFVVDSLAVYPKVAFPTADVYGPAPVPTLRLVTCTGDFDWQTHTYLDNLVVSAHLGAGPASGVVIASVRTILTIERRCPPRPTGIPGAAATELGLDETNEH